MNASNTKKNEQLGMPQGTAANKLRKSILFHCIKKLNENFCFQCGAEILSPDELSIEHKVPYLDSDDPIKLFFDIENIAFSHLGCNCKASRKNQNQTRAKMDIRRKHPSRTTYRLGCRCEGCKKEAAIYRAILYKLKKSQK